MLFYLMKFVMQSLEYVTWNFQKRSKVFIVEKKNFDNWYGDCRNRRKDWQWNENSSSNNSLIFYSTTTTRFFIYNFCWGSVFLLLNAIYLKFHSPSYPQLLMHLKCILGTCTIIFYISFSSKMASYWFTRFFYKEPPL